MSSIRVRYQTLEIGQRDIHLRTLRDNQQFQDQHGEAEKLGISSATWPIFGIVWPSGVVLAHFMLDYQHENKRILEIGCGIALASLLLNQRDADITATDYHPEAGSFLRKNVALNQGQAIPFVRTGWADEQSELGKFDLIIGSDLLYEDEHVELLAEFIDQHANPEMEVILVDPGRGRKAKFSKKMLTLGYTSRQHQPENVDYLDKAFKGHILEFQRQS